MTHKTDVPKTSDLAGFAAREAGQPDKWGPRPVATGDNIKCSFCGCRKAHVMPTTDQLRCVNCKSLIFDDHGILTLERAWTDAQPVPIRIDKEGTWRHAETGEAVGPYSHAAKHGERNIGRYTHSQGDDWRWFDGKKLHRFKYMGMDATWDEDGFHGIHHVDPEEQILVRLDDKLSRLRSAQADEDEDVVDDLIGYLVLLKIARLR